MIKAKKAFKIGDFLETWSTVIVFALVVIIGAITSENFFTVQNVTNLLKQNAGIGIIAMGMLMVVLTGGIDLSVGAIVGLGNVMMAYLLQKHGVAVSALATLGIGILCGAVSGYFVAFKNLQPFVVTLAVLEVARGYAYILCKGASIRIKHQGLLDFGFLSTFGIPNIFYVTVLVFVIVFFLLRYTTYGRTIVAIGSNEEAVRLSGLKTKYYKFSAYLFSGTLSAVAAILNSARTGVGSPLTGDGFELDAIAMCVIGGVSLAGGKGSAWKVLLGVFIIGMIGNIMNLLKISAYTQQVATGVIILAAVVMQIRNSRNN